MLPGTRPGLPSSVLAAELLAQVQHFVWEPNTKGASSDVIKSSLEWNNTSTSSLATVTFKQRFTAKIRQNFSNSTRFFANFFLP
jgi:hypothetical protein